MGERKGEEEGGAVLFCRGRGGQLVISEIGEWKRKPRCVFFEIGDVVTLPSK